MAAETTRPGVAPSAHRSTSFPAKLVERSASRSDDIGIEDQQSGSLFTLPYAELFIFKIPKLADMPQSPSQIWRSIEEDPSFAGILPWNLRSERLHACGPMHIEKRPTALFMKIGTWERYITFKTKCWCVDGESKFAMWLQDTVFRFELPYKTEEDKKKAEELKNLLRDIINFEKTHCPFRREFIVDTSEFAAISPLRNRFVKTFGPPLTPQSERRSISLSLDGARDDQPVSPHRADHDSSDDEPERGGGKTNSFQNNKKRFEASLDNKTSPIGPRLRPAHRSITAPSKLLPLRDIPHENVTEIEDTRDSDILAPEDETENSVPQQQSSAASSFDDDTQASMDQTHIGQISVSENQSLATPEDSLSLTSTNDRLTPTTEEENKSVHELLGRGVLEAITEPTQKSSEGSRTILESATNHNSDTILAPGLELDNENKDDPEDVMFTAPVPTKHNLESPLQSTSQLHPIQRSLTPQLHRRRSTTPIGLNTTRRRENHSFISTLIFTIYAILMTPPSNLLTILAQLAARIANRILNFAGSSSSGSSGPRGSAISSHDSRGTLPGGWDDSDGENSSPVSGADEDDEDDYGVPVGNKTPQRLRRRRLGSSDSGVD